MAYLRKPEWLRNKIYSDFEYGNVSYIIKKHGVNTICKSGRCPNQSECWSKGTATLMILGEICTRSCKFCNTATGRPLPPDLGEPQRIAQSIRLMQLKHAVITSVDRDDLPDRGAKIWAETIRCIKEVNQKITLEVLIPDFDGKTELIDLIINEKPDVISHNLETVRRITPFVRTKAKYDTSLKVLSYLASEGCVAKTGIMVGLGETKKEVLELMDDALKAGCKVITIGQYMQPSRNHIKVAEYCTPEMFEFYRISALEKGFLIAESAPFVRSSYCAEKHLLTEV